MPKTKPQKKAPLNLLERVLNLEDHIQRLEANIAKLSARTCGLEDIIGCGDEEPYERSEGEEEEEEYRKEGVCIAWRGKRHTLYYTGPAKLKKKLIVDEESPEFTQDIDDATIFSSEAHAGAVASMITLKHDGNSYCDELVLI